MTRCACTRARLPGLVSAVMVALLWAAPSGHAASQDVGVVVTGWATPIERQVDLASRLDAGWISFGVVWWRYETTPRSYTRPGHPDRERWTQLGEELAAAKARGLKVSVTFFRPPPWARASDDERAGPAAGRVDDFVRFVDDVARTYGEDIDAYATWNEPNIDQFWRGPDPVAYARLHRAAAGRISAVDPSASIILGPFAGNAPNALGFASSRLRARRPEIGRPAGVERVPGHRPVGPRRCRNARQRPSARAAAPSRSTPADVCGSVSSGGARAPAAARPSTS